MNGKDTTEEALEAMKLVEFKFADQAQVEDKLAETYHPRANESRAIIS